MCSKRGADRKGLTVSFADFHARLLSTCNKLSSIKLTSPLCGHCTEQQELKHNEIPIFKLGARTG